MLGGHILPLTFNSSYLRHCISILSPIQQLGGRAHLQRGPALGAHKGEAAQPIQRVGVVGRDGQRAAEDLSCALCIHRRRGTSQGVDDGARCGEGRTRGSSSADLPRPW